MRAKRTFIILAFVAAVTIALVGCFGKKPEPHIEIKVLEYSEHSDPRFQNVTFMVTNNGPVAVLYDEWDRDEPVILLTESRYGWAAKVIHCEGNTVPRLLHRGSAIGFTFVLPKETLRWQLRYTVWRASSKETVHNKLTGMESNWGEWGYRLDKLGGGLLSTNEGPPQQFLSDVFVVPAGK
jgi:hypothetical protein